MTCLALNFSKKQIREILLTFTKHELELELESCESIAKYDSSVKYEIPMIKEWLRYSFSK
jgi:hypothetical protein